jgi:hypothetical protein
MGILATLVEFTRSVVGGKQVPEAKVDRGGGDTLTAGHFSAPGDDSYPLPTDVVYLGNDEGTGTMQLLGYQDPDTAPVAAPGEKRIFARAGPGVVACEIWLRADGTVAIKNSLTTLELTPTGGVTISNAVGSLQLNAAGLVTFITPLGAFGASTHTHTIPTGQSGPPTPGT